MTKSRFSASRECARRLVEAGCPLDYLEDLPKTSPRRLYIEPLESYATSRVLDLGEGSVRYIIAFRLGTDLASGASVTDWDITAPWGQHVTWDFDPRDIIPKGEWPAYLELLDSRLFAVLNGRGRVYRGRPIAGLVCGQAYFESVPEPSASGPTRLAKLKLSDDAGYAAEADIELTVERRQAPDRAQYRRSCRLFDKRDPIRTVYHRVN